MSDKREFLQRYPPDVLFLLDVSSDIHYGRNHKDLSLQSLMIEINKKKLKNYYWCYCFLCPVDPTSAMIPKIISPAIAVRGDRGIAEGEEATGCVRLGEGVGVLIHFLTGLKSGGALL
jgi:hypothetical protein